MTGAANPNDPGKGGAGGEFEDVNGKRKQSGGGWALEPSICM